MKVTILGKNGMLGEMVTKVLSADPELDVTALGRDDFDAWYDSTQTLIDADWIINCIGIIKPYIKDNPVEAIRINSLFPYQLSELSEIGINIIQIATDCVFAGNIAPTVDGSYYGYTEKSDHDALDIYGKTKSLGEVKGKNFYNIRCSIIGPQAGNPSLLQWFLDLPKNAEINGFSNHWWNGITTLAFADICRGIIKSGKPNVNNFHLIPSYAINKYQLLKLCAEVFDRPDIRIQEHANQYCNRRLDTLYRYNNEQMWKQAGYEKVPSIEELLYKLKETL